MLITGDRLDIPFDINDLLRFALKRDGAANALASTGSRMSWFELQTAAERLAANLIGLGLKPGDRIASLMPNCLELSIHYLACFKAGLVATPLNYRYAAPEIEHALETSEAAVLLVHVERAADVAAATATRRLPLGTIRFGGGDAGGPELGGPELDALIAVAPEAVAAPAHEPDAPAAIFFTSGSTGKPKGVTHSRESLGWMFAAIARAFELTADDALLPGSSMSHLGGFAFSNAALGAGSRVVIARRYDAGEILPLLRNERPTVMAMLPTALLHLIRDKHAAREDFASLRLCRGGADKVSAELENEFTELTGFPIDEGYGMTEVGLAALNPPSGTIKIGSVGPPIPGFRLSTRDESGAECAAGEDGNLWMKTPSMMVGYWNRPDATAETIRDGWIDSGDIMRADEDGYFWFRGRKKQIIVHDGSNICPQEVEEALLEHPAVDNAGVVGVHDLVHGENVRAYVTLKAEAPTPTAHELIAFARERIGYKAPEEIDFLDEMPLNATGKIDRVALKERAAAAHGSR